MSVAGEPGRIRVALVPGCLALLAEYAGQHDPVPAERAAATAAVAWLGPAHVVGSAQGRRVGAQLLARAGHPVLDDPAAAPGLLVVANGTAMRTEQAPGHLDERAEAYDAELGRRLRGGDLAGIDAALGAELWAEVEPLVELTGLVDLDPSSAVVDLESDPYGVRYWVVRWAGVRRSTG